MELKEEKRIVVGWVIVRFRWMRMGMRMRTGGMLVVSRMSSCLSLSLSLSSILVEKISKRYKGTKVQTNLSFPPIAGHSVLERLFSPLFVTSFLSSSFPPPFILVLDNGGTR